MLTVRVRSAVIVSSFFLVAIVAGCSGASLSRSQVDRSTTPPEGVYTTTLRGLVVTVETTPGLAPDISGGTSFVQPGPPAADKVRMTVHATAVNSTDATVSMQIEHNFPTLRDSAGDYLQPVNGSATAGPSGSKFSRGGESLGPGGVFETMQSYDVDPGQSGLRFVWDFEDLGSAEFMLHSPE